MMGTFIKWILPAGLIAGLLLVVWQLLFPATARLDAMADYGAIPTLARPARPLIPTIRPARAIGWNRGERPQPAEGLAVRAFARDLEHPRWLHVLPNGDVLVAESDAPAGSGTCSRLKNWVAGWVMRLAGGATPSADRISLLRDADGDGIAEQSHAFLEGLHSPFGMALVGTDLYVANADAVMRFDYVSGDTEIRSAGVRVVDLPAGQNHHWTKNIVASTDGGSLYIAVGSNSNAGECGPGVEAGRAAIHRLDLATGQLTPFASGLRNPVGMAIEPDSDRLWAAVNERDEIGGDLVPDYVTSVQQGDFFGWPYLYYGSHHQPGLDPRWPTDERAARVPDYAVGNHTASLGILFADGNSLPAGWQSGLFVSQHGSWNRKPRSGYRVIYIPFEQGVPAGDPREVLGGFLDGADQARGRPVGMALDQGGGVLVADDVGNVIWRIASAAGPL